MEQIPQVLRSILVAAILCACADLVCKHLGRSGKLIQMLTGIYFTLALLSPFFSLDWGNILSLPQDWTLSNQAPIREGVESSQESVRAIIRAQLEAYILEKAESMGLTLQVRVEVEGEDVPVPVAAYLQGYAAPYHRGQLEDYIEEKLGIPKEAQHWTG